LLPFDTPEKQARPKGLNDLNDRVYCLDERSDRMSKLKPVQSLSGDSDLLRAPTLLRSVRSTQIVSLLLLRCFLSLLLLLSSATALAAEVKQGKMFYIQYCSACHGQEGHGNGPVSRYINVKIPDLSLLKKNNHGVYPLDQVLSAIDGRRDVRAHGDRQMPVWGEVFTIEERKYPEQSGGLKAKLIADYVATLQR
jgi:mono/diheme cytochrome c family protein